MQSACSCCCCNAATAWLLQARAQKQLQQLRKDRKGPSKVHDIVAETKSTFEHSQSSSNNNAAGLQAARRPLKSPDKPEKLPTKAELRGTLGTVNRQVLWWAAEYTVSIKPHSEFDA